MAAQSNQQHGVIKMHSDSVCFSFLCDCWAFSPHSYRQAHLANITIKR